jgi:hypothetical protein
MSDAKVNAGLCEYSHEVQVCKEPSQPNELALHLHNQDDVDDGPGKGGVAVRVISYRTLEARGYGCAMDRKEG